MKKFLFATLMILSTNTAFGVLTGTANTVPGTDFAYALDRQFSPAQAFKQSLGTRVLHAHSVAYGTWSAALGGTSGKSYLVGITLPTKSIIRKVFTDPITNPLTNVSFGVSTAGDLKSVTSTWTGLADGTPDGTAANMVKVTSPSNQIFASITGSTATSGKIRIFVDYVLSE